MKVGVIMGGISSEREISLQSGKSVVENLDKNKYEIIPIVLNEKEDIIKKVKDIDFALLALHGKFGEDGNVQAVLQTLDIPYSGCGPLSSGLCMDKDMTKRILAWGGVRTAKWLTVTSIEEINYSKIQELGYPVFVKPNSGGSSVATTFVERKEEIEKAVKDALEYDNEVMVEEYIQGDEITCPILNNKMLPVLAIKPKGKFFDIESKYEDGGADEFIVKLNDDLHKEVEKMALDTYKLLKCSVYSRIDMLVKNNVPYVLEVNTLPGMTKNSLFPKSALGIDINFSELLDLIIKYSLEEKR
ncbi:D-alanine--D-alanine ligase [Clostridium tarantellae]|uniref:D-alanine--D-alanine ligase n=1 Tax=Clostridium tarantellae TaxID=39493 RepID=A0A6I1ML52_9CLOT|nr:D-alanine--D-alanine ligase [Clostridium tarantellae]MPQ43188.1 D-alanine--D-alanine ligase [Clostridium tarantellae]